MRNFFTLLMILLVGSASYAQDCSDLYFSEYIEGSSNNKALEIYNPTSSTINLASYVVATFSNGKTTTTNVMRLKGMLASGDVYVIANSSADAKVLAESDVTGNVTFFNGDDAVVFGKFDTINLVVTDTLDIIGIYGNDPGSNWTVGTGSTGEHTLVRKATVKEGTTDWAVSATQWEVESQDEFGFIGSHTSACIKVAPPEKTIVDFGDYEIDVLENAGTFYVYVWADTIAPTDTVKLDVSVIGGTATSGTDYTFSATSLSLDSSKLYDSVEVTLTDDSDIEWFETIQMVLKITAGNAEADIDTIDIYVIDNDFALSKLKDVMTLEPDGSLINKDSVIKIRGVVHGPDYQPTRLEFRLWDGTGAITVFEFDNIWNYKVRDGDSIEVVGYLDQYNGLAQLRLDDYEDAITILDSNKNLMPIVTYDSLYDAIESHLIKVTGLTLGSGPNSCGGDCYWVKKSNGDSMIMRLDSDVPVFGFTSFPAKFNVTGFVSQFNDFQLTPRDSTDIESAVGLAPITNTEVTVYPNPTNGMLYINTSENIDFVKVINLVGTEVMSFSNVKNQMDISALSNGVYLLQGTLNNGETFVTKVNKQ